MDALAFGAIATIAVVFLISGASKLRSGTFRADLANYRLLPGVVVPAAALVLPWLELALGSGLIVGYRPTVLLLGAVFLLIAFTTGMTINLLRGRRINCGCRGAERPIGWGLVSSNAAMIGAGLAAMWVWPAPVASVLSGGESRLSADDAVAVLVSTAACLMLWRLGIMWRRLNVALTSYEAPIPVGRAA